MQVFVVTARLQGELVCEKVEADHVQSAIRAASFDTRKIVSIVEIGPAEIPAIA